MAEVGSSQSEHSPHAHRDYALQRHGGSQRRGLAHRNQLEADNQRELYPDQGSADMEDMLDLNVGKDGE